MRIRILGFTSDSNKPPSRHGLYAAILSCSVLGFFFVQQLLKREANPITIAVLGVILISSVYHLFYQVRGLYRQKKQRSAAPASIQDPAEPTYDTPKEGENFYCPYCSRVVEDEYEFCNTCGKKLP